MLQGPEKSRKLPSFPSFGEIPLRLFSLGETLERHEWSERDNRLLGGSYLNRLEALFGIISSISQNVISRGLKLKCINST